MTWSMIPCSPATAFCSMVGQAIRQTARPSGPSTIERSKVCSFSGNGQSTNRDRHTHVPQMQQRRAANLVRRLTAQQAMIEIARTGGLRVDRDVEAAHQRLARGGGEAHMRVE